MTEEVKKENFVSRVFFLLTLSLCLFAIAIMIITISIAYKKGLWPIPAPEGSGGSWGRGTPLVNAYFQAIEYMFLGGILMLTSSLFHRNVYRLLFAGIMLFTGLLFFLDGGKLL